jgi:hypothetical protein
VDFPLSSSVILVIAVALWIVWVAPYVLRNRWHQLQPAGELMAEVNDVEPADPQAGNVMRMAAQQEKPMDIKQSPESVPSGATLAQGRPPAASGSSGLRIRYGRCAIALVGLASLLTVFVAGLLAIFGIGTAWLPASALFVTVATMVLLRRLALRDRRAKVNAAFRAAMAPQAPRGREDEAREPAGKPEDPGHPAKPAESQLFDAEAEQPRPKPLTAQELREAAMAVAVAAGDTGAQSPARTEAGTKDTDAEDTPWEPVEVPKPTYVEAAKAERPAPEPLDLPEAPKSVGKPSLKQGTAAAPPAAAPQQRPLTKAQSALSNLDDVLQRRRA